MKTITYADLTSDENCLAQRLIDYFEGKQLAYMNQILTKYRKHWQQRNIIPRIRNITKMVVEKSSQLFNEPPSLQIVTAPGVKPLVDEQLQALFERADWLEFFQNVDEYTRLCQTSVVLLQRYVAAPTLTVNNKYVPNFDAGDALLFTLLTPANSAVKMDVTGTRVAELAFLTSDIVSNEFTYCHMDADYISHWQVKDESETLISRDPNLDGMVPAVMFYDTRRPRKGAFNKVPEDLVTLNEMVNLAMTDTDYAMAHQKHKTLYTNARMTPSGNKNGSTPIPLPVAEEGFTPGGTNYPSNTLGTSAVSMGGLGEVISLSTSDPSGEKPFVEFLGPVSDLHNLEDVLSSMIKQVAYDWSVNVRVDGSGHANSGFQIVVEEIDSLQLREKRAQSFQAGFRRLYEVLKALYPTLTDGQLKVIWAPPSLPINTAENENIWTTRIEQGRASVLDYLREVGGMDDATAYEKIQEIQAVNSMLGWKPALTAQEQATAVSDAPSPGTASPPAPTTPIGTP